MTPSAMPTSGSKAGLIAGAVALLVVGGIVGYVMGKGGSKPVASETSTLTPTPSVSSTTSSSRKYINISYGFSLDIPSTWTVLERTAYVIFSSPEDEAKDMENQENCRANPPVNCNAEAAYFQVIFSSREEAKDLSEAQKTEVIGGITFRSYIQEGLFPWKNYVTTNDAKTYNFTFSNSAITPQQFLSTFKFTK